MVIVAVAFPFASSVTELELSEQVGAPPNCVGCTEHARDTGYSNAFSSVRVRVEVALWPWLRVAGVTAEAEIEKSEPVLFSSTPTSALPAFVPTMSGALFPVRSPSTGWRMF
jgi:hypothetical protein